MAEERFPQLLTTGRLRKRGPRSYDAKVRRYQRTNSGQQHPPSDDFGKSGSESLVCDSNITFLFLNLGYLCNRAELEAYIKPISTPGIVGMTESFLDASIQSVHLSGYIVVSRLVAVAWFKSLWFKSCCDSAYSSFVVLLVIFALLGALVVATFIYWTYYLELVLVLL